MAEFQCYACLQSQTVFPLTFPFTRAANQINTVRCWPVGWPLRVQPSWYSLSSSFADTNFVHLRLHGVYCQPTQITRYPWSWEIAENPSSQNMLALGSFMSANQPVSTCGESFFQDLQVYLIIKIKIFEVTIPDYWSFISENSMSFGICSNSFLINYHSVGSLRFPSQ